MGVAGGDKVAAAGSRFSADGESRGAGGDFLSLVRFGLEGLEGEDFGCVAG